MHVWRPCDAVESAVAWRMAVERRNSPSTLVFTRQGLPCQTHTDETVAGIRRGGYVLSCCDECGNAPDAIIIATGSEVQLAMAAQAELAAQGKRVRVVSMPCVELFEEQDDAYKESVLPAAVTRRVAVEAGVTGFWYKYVGLDGRVIGIDRFGESAPAAELFREFGITTEAVVSAVNDLL